MEFSESRHINLGNDIHVYTNCFFMLFLCRYDNLERITTERSVWRNLFKDVSTTLDMTSVDWLYHYLTFRYRCCQNNLFLRTAAEIY